MCCSTLCALICVPFERAGCHTLTPHTVKDFFEKADVRVASLFSNQMFSLVDLSRSRLPSLYFCQTSFYFPSLCISAWGFFLRCKIMVMTSPILKFRSNDKLKALVNNVKSILLVSQQNKIEQWEVTQCLWRNPYKHKKVGGGKRKSAWGRKKWWSQEKEKI